MRILGYFPVLGKWKPVLDWLSHTRGLIEARTLQSLSSAEVGRVKRQNV